MAEVGLFFKTVVHLEKEERKEKLTSLWMGANLQYKGLKEVLDNIGKNGEDNTPTTKEVNDDWKRLASFMVGKT